ncbi:hypothetical protein N0V85_003053 [Neurospora sp. IMI 360204]|nr:hypothetical protein N0V85_003053 [Neurospora sp. IMI 360204]
MKRDHNLSASDKQYKRYFKIWAFEKNYKTSEMISMLKIQQKRLKEGKKTVFFNENGEIIPKIKFTRFNNRHNIKEFKDEELQEGTVVLAIFSLGSSLMLGSRNPKRHHLQNTRTG